MRDDRNSWTPYDGAWAPFKAEGIAITPAMPERQTLISAPAILSRHPGAIGWPDIATGDAYAISLRRDELDRPGAMKSRTRPMGLKRVAAGAGGCRAHSVR